MENWVRRDFLCVLYSYDLLNFTTRKYDFYNNDDDNITKF